MIFIDIYELQNIQQFVHITRRREFPCPVGYIERAAFGLKHVK